jgi:hypothetical protein
MGRNSVEATKASLIRAVRARLAALTAGLAGFLVAALPDLPAGFTVFVPDLAGVFALGAGFFFAVEDACPAGLVVEAPFVEPLVDCPVTGSTIIKKENRPARQKNASRETEVGEDETLISSLYLLPAACGAAQRRQRTTGVTANMAKWDSRAELDLSRDSCFPFGPLPRHPVHLSTDPKAQSAISLAVFATNAHANHPIDCR